MPAVSCLCLVAISRRDNCFDILRRDISWIREKHLSGAWEAFTPFGFGNLHWSSAFSSILLPQLKHWSGNQLSKVWYCSRCAHGHVLKEKVVIYSILQRRLSVWCQNYIFLGSIFTIRKIDLGLKAHYTHFHYSSGFCGEDEKKKGTGSLGKNIS